MSFKESDRMMMDAVWTDTMEEIETTMADFEVELKVSENESSNLGFLPYTSSNTVGVPSPRGWPNQAEPSLSAISTLGSLGT